MSVDVNVNIKRDASQNVHAKWVESYAKQKQQIIRRRNRKHTHKRKDKREQERKRKHKCMRSLFLKLEFKQT